MGSKIEYVDSAHMYASNYVRNSKAIGVLWAIFTICYAIIGAVAFLTPEWIGEAEGEYPGRAGVWQVCRSEEGGETCEGRLDEFWSLPGVVFRIVTVLVGAAVAVALFTICAMLLFFFCQSTTVFHICGWLQLISALCLVIGVALYPAAWSEGAVQETCGPGADQYRLALCLVIGVALYPAAWSEGAVQETCGPGADQYRLGRCTIRWAYLLAGIACLDAVILSTLAFILATRHIRLHPDSPYNNGSLYRGEVNNAYVTDAASMSGSRKSLALQPVLIMHPHAAAPLDVDAYSQYSHRTKHLPHYRL